MKTATHKPALSVGLALMVALLPNTPRPMLAQYQFAPFPGMASPTTPDAQRNAMKAVEGQVTWLQNATRTASAYTTGASDLVWSQFQALRTAYSAFTTTLNPQQSADGANELAELSSGLDILQEAFTNYQDDLASGRAASLALRDLCQVLNQAAAVWLREFKEDCTRLRVGW
jgi:hypothetical protein